MSKQASNRVLAAGKEPLCFRGPLRGLFLGCDVLSPATFRQCADEIVQAIELDILVLSDPNGENRKQSVIEQIKLGVQIAQEAAHDMKQFSNQRTLLSEDQIAIIHFYSQEIDAERYADSAYSIVNAALRSEDRNKARALKNFIWLFMTGLRLCPKTEYRVLHRGVSEDLRTQYTVNRIITWYQISSCTSTIEVLENPLFLGKSGHRTIFSIELAVNTRARCISEFSSMRNENEVLLPPNTRLQVLCLS
jgi:hypothetical protein